MTDAASTANPAPATDPAAEAMARALAHLDELAGIGMTFAHALGRIAQAAVDEADGETPGMAPGLADAALAFSHVSRAVRMTVGLQAKILRERQARADRLAADKAVKDAEAAQILEERRAKGGLRRAMTRFIVRTAIEAEEREEDEVDRLFEGLNARIAEIGDDGLDFEDVHIKDTAFAIAKDLGADPGSEWWEEGWGISSPPPKRSFGGGGPRSGGGGKEGLAGSGAASDPPPQMAPSG